MAVQLVSYSTVESNSFGPGKVDFDITGVKGSLFGGFGYMLACFASRDSAGNAPTVDSIYWRPGGSQQAFYEVESSSFLHTYALVQPFAVDATFRVTLDAAATATMGCILLLFNGVLPSHTELISNAYSGTASSVTQTEVTSVFPNTNIISAMMTDSTSLAHGSDLIESNALFSPSGTLSFGDATPGYLNLECGIINGDQSNSRATTWTFGDPTLPYRLINNVIDFSAGNHVTTPQYRIEPTRILTPQYVITPTHGSKPV
jgi:hypothetical protein